MKSYSATFPMRGENFGDRLFASWHSAASFVCGNVKLACCFASSTNRHFLRLGKAVQRLPWQQYTGHFSHAQKSAAIMAPQTKPLSEPRTQPHPHYMWGSSSTNRHFLRLGKAVQRLPWQQYTGRQPSCVGKTDAIAQTKPLTQRYPLRVGKTD